MNLSEMNASQTENPNVNMNDCKIETIVSPDVEMNAGFEKEDKKENEMVKNGRGRPRKFRYTGDGKKGPGRPRKYMDPNRKTSSANRIAILHSKPKVERTPAVKIEETFLNVVPQMEKYPVEVSTKITKEKPKRKRQPRKPKIEPIVFDYPVAPPVYNNMTNSYRFDPGMEMKSSSNTSMLLRSATDDFLNEHESLDTSRSYEDQYAGPMLSGISVSENRQNVLSIFNSNGDEHSDWSHESPEKAARNSNNLLNNDLMEFGSLEDDFDLN